MTTTSEEVEKSYSYLGSQVALQSIERDPYWPKWDSPWWHMLLLHELGETRKIPEETILKYVIALNRIPLKIFPIRPIEIPVGLDLYRSSPCHCQLGSVYQVISAWGLDVDGHLPWIRPWLLRYQLPDGGLNCDEKAYTKTNPKSSIVSTLPCLEAILFCHKYDLTSEETAYLNRGANYLLKQRLFRKISSSEVIDKDWLEIRFPRFYEYDFLRGFYFLAKWRELSGFAIPDDLVDEVEELVSKQMTEEGIRLKRYNLFEKRSYNSSSDGSWAWGQASEFDLMKQVSCDGNICTSLTEKWNEVKPVSATVSESYETAYTNPIRLEVGDSVKIEMRETNPEWIGWIFCIDAQGIKGWVSEKYLKQSDGTAVVIKKYDATELTASAGEHLKIFYEEFGWCWCRNKNGIKGWIPKKNLKVLQN